MKNEYMFFTEQHFSDLDLTGYKKTDMAISKTPVHIYQFECIDAEQNLKSEHCAKQLDELTQRLREAYPDYFQIVNSESSKYFCEQLYPFVVNFEVKLRYVIYISRALYMKESIDKNSFLIKLRCKDSKSNGLAIENADFGQIYQVIFTDESLRSKVLSNYSGDMTKQDLIKKIQNIDETTMWQKWIGMRDTYIAEHFLEIKDIRNDVMHNHLISYDDYITSKNTMTEAILELDNIIKDKLLSNKSPYLNNINSIDLLGEVLSDAAEQIATCIDPIKAMQNISKAMSTLAEALCVSQSSEDDSLQQEEN